MEKIKRIKDKKAIDDARLPYCEHCGYSGTDQGYQVHHIQSRGSGGDDVPQNLICLCYECHRKFHDGNIKREVFERIVKRRNDYT